MTREQKLEDWAEREFPRVIDSMILSDTDGTVVAFGKYRLQQKKNFVQLYVNQEPLLQFADRRSALSWCVADKHQQFNLARHISQLDQQKRFISDDIETRRQLAHRSRSGVYQDTVSIKLSTKIRHRSMVSEQLEKCIAQAKYIQIRGFTNETARARR